MLIGGNNTVKDLSYKMINFYEYHNGQLDERDKYADIIPKNNIF